MEIKEIILVQVDENRKYFATIKRETVDEHDVIYGQLNIEGKIIYSMANDVSTLGLQMDQLAKLVLDYELFQNVNDLN